MARPGMIDYYAELEVERGADEATIKKSYRKLVLKYHPDKNPEDRESAEEKIRIINNAYETLSNPAKRAAFDTQLRAMDIRNQGLRVDTSRIQPRMSIPKAFMLCPMGYPDKFLRMMGRSLAFHSRGDVAEVEFEDFFKVARFTLWWLPEVNNMCRLRTQPHLGTGLIGMPEVRGKGKAGGPPVGQILSFGLSQMVSASDVMVSDIEQPHCCNIIAVASPDFPGAFRFESAFYPGHFLTFEPPTGVQMTRVDKFSVIDYMLMDFGVCEKFKTLDEVLIPSILSLGGDKQFVKLASVCQDSRVLAYFKVTMCGSTWDYNDFALYFHAHSERWDYDANQQLLWLRGPEEKLALTLKRAKSAEEVVSRLNVVKQQLQWLPLDVVHRALHLLAKSGKGWTQCDGESHKAASMKVLTVVRDMCLNRNRTSLDSLLPLWDMIFKFGGKDAESDMKQLRSETMQAVGRCASKLLLDPDVSLGPDAVGILLDMPLDWETCGPAIAKKAQQMIAKMSLEDMTPLLRKAGKARAETLGETLATSAMMKTIGAPPEFAVEALDAMVSGGFLLDGAAMTLRRLQDTLTSSEPITRVVAGLMEHNADFNDLDVCWESLVDKGFLEAIPASLFIRLVAAAAKPSGVHSSKLVALGKATSQIMAADKWPVDDATELLLTLSGSGNLATLSADCSVLLTSVMDFLRPKLAQFSATQLVNVTTGVLRVKACRPLVESAAAQLASQFSDMSPLQLLPLTKALLALGNNDTIFQQVVDLWKKRLSDDVAKTVSACDKAETTLNPGDVVQIFGLTSEAGSRLNGHSGTITRFITEKSRFEVRLGGGFSSGDTMSISPKNLKKDRPKWRQMSQGLAADQLAELAQLLTGVDPEHGVFDALAENLVEQMEALTAEGSASLEAALRAGTGGAKFRRRVGRERDRSQSRVRERDRSHSRGKEVERSRRARSRSRGRERNRSRSRDKQRGRSRSRGRARNRSRSREKDRDRSRSRGRARDRSRSRGRRR